MKYCTCCDVEGKEGRKEGGISIDSSMGIVWVKSAHASLGEG